jgi:hypothetical protein
MSCCIRTHTWRGIAAGSSRPQATCFCCKPQVQPISLFSVWFESIQPMLNLGPSEPLKLSRMEVWVAVPAFSSVPPVAEIGPLHANKKHSFHNWREKERREALSISGAERSPEGRGSEHAALLGYAPRRAAQAGLTEGAGRSGRLRRARDLLVVPVLGIDRMPGWLGPLNKAVYPKREEYRTRRTARGCPSFGMSTLLAGPENQTICPGIHQPEVGSHEVAWWTPAHCDWMLMPNSACEL